jgi:hypothetical protein
VVSAFHTPTLLDRVGLVAEREEGASVLCAFGANQHAASSLIPRRCPQNGVQLAFFQISAARARLDWSPQFTAEFLSSENATDEGFSFWHVVHSFPGHGRS